MLHTIDESFVYIVCVPPYLSCAASWRSLAGTVIGRLLIVTGCNLGAQGFPEKASTKLEDYGYIQSRPKGEYHANNQQMAKLLHKAVQLGDNGPGNKVRHVGINIMVDSIASGARLARDSIVFPAG